MKEKAYPSEKLDKFMLRFPDGMRDDIKNAAEASGRSMNAEIVHRLQQSFAGSSSVPESLLGQLFDSRHNKLLESEAVDSEDIAQLLSWISEVQGSLVQRLIHLNSHSKGDE
ncbi:hypothetical protein GCM10022421_31990 [Oceanisphaera sediminis]|uniref:Arc-like DNA binding domain-containing protein n=1 Tax=Oceanisphaera sediminis TaxID=981381 RepID=A0ABP7EMD6_9GAMM